MRSVYSLHGLYPDNRRLFSNLLGLGDASLQHLIKEALQFTTTDDLEYITDVFLELEKHITDNTPTSETSSLRKQSIFPVQGVGTGLRFSSLRSSNAAHEWFIADATHLKKSFDNKVPLLAVDVADVGRLKRFLKAAGVEGRKLSHAVEGSAETVGSMWPWEQYTNRLRDRAEFILR
jgi:hypothetical protein